VTDFTERVAAAFKAACRDELDAPKPGNIHLFAAGHQMTAADFVRSADAAAGPLCSAGARVGERILGAVEATFAAVGTNTNLGIILLCAPLAAAAEAALAASSNLRAALAQVLAGLDRDDASFAFRAIVRASPGGLGRAERHDVFEPVVATLSEAMAEAADRDCIARQYVSAFEDVFDLGERELRAASQRWPDTSWPTLAVYLGFLSAFPDSHIVRQHGTAAAEDVRRMATVVHERIRSVPDPRDLMADILDWDSLLKQQDVNPGTSADLTVATLFTHQLRNILPPEDKSD
jgi:triphosphoribosyl-dephospho-CoA synthase